MVKQRVGFEKSEKEERHMDKLAFFSRLFKRKNKEELTSLDTEVLAIDKAANEDDKSLNKEADEVVNSPSTMTKEVLEDKKAPFSPSQLTVEDVESLSPDDSIAAFLAKGVSKEVKRAALDKLFKNPVFNVRDGLNEYDLDYSNPKKLSAESAAQLRHLGDKLVEKSKQHLAESKDATELASSDENQTEDMSSHQTDEENTFVKHDIQEKDRLTQIAKTNVQFKEALKDQSEKKKF